MIRRWFRYNNYSVPIGRGEWNPLEYHSGVLSRYKQKLWRKFLGIGHKRKILRETWNFCFNLTFGSAYNHFKKFYYVAFLFQFLAIITDLPEIAVIGLVVGILGFFADKWTESVRMRVEASAIARKALGEDLQKASVWMS